jgi:Tat protein secretion system quality control protein TatD with DNase activity
VAQELAKIKNCSVETIAQASSDNFSKLFKGVEQ